MQFISSVTSSHPALPVAVGEPSTSSACDQTASPSEQVLEEPENVKIALVPTSSRLRMILDVKLTLEERVLC